MNNIVKNSKIRVEWTIFRGDGLVPVNFYNALLKVFLIGPSDRYLLDVSLSTGIPVVELPVTLPVGVYSLEAIWVPGVDGIPRGRFSSRYIGRSRKDYPFTINEADKDGKTETGGDPFVLKVKSYAGSYGYAGISAYEMDVLSGDFSGSESEWQKWLHGQILEDMGRILNNVYLDYKGSSFDTRNSLPLSMRRRNVIITYLDEVRNVITERCVNDTETDNAHFGLDTNWKRIGFQDLVDSYESDDVGKAPTAAALYRLYLLHRKDDESVSNRISALRDFVSLSMPITATPSVIDVESEAQSVSVRLSCNGKWSVSPGFSSQIVVSPMSGVGDGTIQVSFKENVSDGDISGTFEIVNDYGSKTSVSFVQHAAVYDYAYNLTVNRSPASVGANKGDDYFDIISTRTLRKNGVPIASPEPAPFSIIVLGNIPWFRLKGTDGKYEYDENTSESSRTVNVEVAQDPPGYRKSCSVTQAAATVTWDHQFELSHSSLVFDCGSGTQTVGVTSTRQKRINGNLSGEAEAVGFRLPEQ